MQVRQQELQQQEVYLLILHFLASSPCQDAFTTLFQEASKHKLLPTRTDIHGIPYLNAERKTMWLSDKQNSCMKIPTSIEFSTENIAAPYRLLSRIRPGRGWMDLSEQICEHLLNFTNPPARKSRHLGSSLT